MNFLLIASLQFAAYAQSDEAELANPVDSPPLTTINSTLEYDSFCRMYPYDLCTHTLVPDIHEIYEFTC